MAEGAGSELTGGYLWGKKYHDNKNDYSVSAGLQCLCPLLLSINWKSIIKVYVLLSSAIATVEDVGLN